jgi:hypothetical protein
MKDTTLDALDIIIIISCILSLLGGLVLMLTCLAPANRRKHARELLFWLSFSDTITSVTYIVSVMFPKDQLFCKATALISIFFPVASFLWTDIIALYLYAIVVSREFRNEKEWRSIMRRCKCEFTISPCSPHFPAVVGVLLLLLICSVLCSCCL